MEFIKKIVGGMLITILLIGQLPADTLMYTHISNDRLQQEIIRVIKKDLRDKEENKKNIKNALTYIRKLQLFTFSLEVFLIISGSIIIRTPSIMVFQEVFLLLLFFLIGGISIDSILSVKKLTGKLEILNENIIFVENMLKYFHHSILISNTNECNAKEKIIELKIMKGNKENSYNLKMLHLLFNDTIEFLIYWIINPSQIDTEQYNIILYADMGYAA